MVRRGLLPSRSEAAQAIAEGLVTVDGAPALKSATQVHAGQNLVVRRAPRVYVSRGGDKLAHALERFGVRPDAQRCLDAGVSTGGFTDVLLRHGAAHVLACDVGYGQVHERIRGDPRVTLLERTNVRELTSAQVPAPPPTLIVADLSFIALAVVLPVLREVAADGAEAIVLVKPQFEAGRRWVTRGGVVRDPDGWREALSRVVAAASGVGWWTAGATASPLVGPAGNVEFLLHLQVRARSDDEVATWLEAAIGEGRQRLQAPRTPPSHAEG